MKSIHTKTHQNPEKNISIEIKRASFRTIFQKFKYIPSDTFSRQLIWTTHFDSVISNHFSHAGFQIISKTNSHVFIAMDVTQLDLIVF